MAGRGELRTPSTTAFDLWRLEWCPALRRLAGVNITYTCEVAVSQLAWTPLHSKPPDGLICRNPRAYASHISTFSFIRQLSADQPAANVNGLTWTDMDCFET